MGQIITFLLLLLFLHCSFADDDLWSLQVQFLGLMFISSLQAAVAKVKWWKSIPYSGRDLNDLSFSES